MCFSTEASFTIATVTLITGIASIKKVFKKEQLVFASIPLIFSIQQFIEGFLWLAFTNDSFSGWKNTLSHLFIMVAQVIWPVWVPLAFLLLAKDGKRKKLLMILTIIGGSLSLFLLYCLLTYPVKSIITEHHIYYETNYPDFANLGAIFYFIVTIFPPFISQVKGAWILGLLNLISFIISKIFFNEHVISVWCFMAAAISVIVIIIIKNDKKTFSTKS